MGINLREGPHMNYIFYKKQKHLKTFLLLDGDGRQILHFNFTCKFLWVFIICFSLLLIWHQYAEDYHRWVLREIDSYPTTYTVNKLQKYYLYCHIFFLFLSKLLSHLQNSRSKNIYTVNIVYSMLIHTT